MSIQHEKIALDALPASQKRGPQQERMREYDTLLATLTPSEAIVLAPGAGETVKGLSHRLGRAVTRAGWGEFVVCGTTQHKGRDIAFARVKDGVTSLPPSKAIEAQKTPAKAGK